MKLRLLPIFLMLFGAAGIVLFATTPVVMTRARFVDEPNDTDLTININVQFSGNGAWIMKGDYLGVDAGNIDPVDKDDWSSYLIYTDPYPDISSYLTFIGLGLAFLGIFLSIFGYSDGLRVAGAILGILGAGISIAGCFLLYNWNKEFQEDAGFHMMVQGGFLATPHTVTYSTFGPGWLAAVTSSGLIAFGSIFLIATKPEKRATKEENEKEKQI